MKRSSLLVENKLQPQTGFVGGAATEAIVGELLFLYLVTRNSFVPGHGTKMEQSRSGCKWETAFRDSLFARESLPPQGLLQNRCGLFGVPESILICSSVCRLAYQQGFTPNCGSKEFEQLTSWSPA